MSGSTLCGKSVRERERQFRSKSRAWSRDPPAISGIAHGGSRPKAARITLLDGCCRQGPLVAGSGQECDEALAAVDVPDANLAVEGTGRESLRGVVVGGRVDPVGVPRESLQELSILEGMEAGRAIGAATEDSAVGCHGDAEDLVPEAGDSLNFLGVGDVPTPKALVAAAGHDRLAVGRHTDAEDQLAMSVEGDK